MTGIARPPRDPKLAALDVLELAHRVAIGEVHLPRLGQGPVLVDGRIVVPDEVHAVLCGWATSRLWESAPVRECLGCGLLRRVTDAHCAPDPPPDERAEADVVPMRRAAR